MKILFLTARFCPSIGGVEKHVLEVARELTEKGHEVKIVTELSPDFKNNKKNNYQSIGKSDTYSINSRKPVKSSHFAHIRIGKIDIYYFDFGKPGFNKKFRIWNCLLKNKNLFKDSDIVHCHDVFFWYFPLRFLNPGKKVFTTFHGYETKFPPSFKSKVIRKISECLSNGNICIGDFIKKWYGTKPNFILYGGVAVKIKNRKSKIKTKSSNSTLKILFIGRLEEDTGILLYLRALNLLKDKGFRFEFTVLGDGSYKKQTEKLGKVLGFVKNIDEFIEKSDIVFASSYLSILESLAHRKEVFSVYSNSLKEDYLKMSPFKEFMNIAGKEETLAEDLMNRKEEKINLDKAYAFAKEQSWDKVTDVYLKLWKK